MADGSERDVIDDRVDQSNAGESEEFPSEVGSGVSSGASTEIGLAERLTDALVEDGDGDLLLQHSNSEDRVLQWLQALDLQVIGACRADERMKPFLKLNSSSGVADDRLLTHLIQHFEPAEVGMLARCFCAPLVSIRAGKIHKQGTLLCPAPTRGNLNLTLLPTSDLRLSFVGDDGQMEQIVTLSSNCEHSSVAIEEISNDTSGRSFVIKVQDRRVFFFWCSEKSKLLGSELLGKMKDLLNRRPSVAELTGIDESRLECFATYIRAYLVGSAVCGTQPSVSSSVVISTVSPLVNVSKKAQSSSISASKSPQLLGGSSQAPKANSLYQADLISSFEEALPGSFLCSSSMTREKLKIGAENPLLAADISLTISQLPLDTSHSVSGDIVKSVGSNINPFSPGFLDSLGKLTIPPSPNSVSQVSFTAQPIFSPYYCWCPPGSSTSQQSLSAPELLSSNVSALLTPSFLQSPPPTQSINLADLPQLDFPAFLPDSMVCLSKPASQQIPTFTPLTCDPIVHVPFIDACSAGQGYLLSAGPTVPATISPLHPNLVHPLMPETDSVVEDGARETLRLLLSGSGPTNPPLAGVLPLPAVLADQSPSGTFVAGSRGLFCGTRNVDAIISSSFTTVGLMSSPKSGWPGDSTSCCGDDSVNKDVDAANPCNSTEETM